MSADADRFSCVRDYHRSLVSAVFSNTESTLLPDSGNSSGSAKLARMTTEFGTVGILDRVTDPRLGHYPLTRFDSQLTAGILTCFTRVGTSHSIFRPE